MRKVFCSILFGLILVLCLQDFLYAGIGVDPVVLEVLVTPGETKKGVFRVFNEGEKSMDVIVCPEKWIEQTLDFGQWLKLDPVRFTIDSKKSKNVNYEINVPEEVTGELMCMVFFITREKGKEASPIGVKFGVPIYAVVQGTGNIEAVIESINLSYDNENHTISGNIIIDNKSNVHIRPVIELTILDEKNELAAGFKLPYGQPAQKEQKRKFAVNQKRVLKPGNYKVVVKADCGKLYGIDKIIQGEADFVIEEKASSSKSEQVVLPTVGSPETK